MSNPHELDLESIFSHHPPASEEVANNHQLVRDLVKDLAYSLLLIVPPSPERTLAIRKLQEAMMFSNSAIAQHGK